MSRDIYNVMNWWWSFLSNGVSQVPVWLSESHMQVLGGIWRNECLHPDSYSHPLTSYCFLSRHKLHDICVILRQLPPDLPLLPTISHFRPENSCFELHTESFPIPGQHRLPPISIESIIESLRPSIFHRALELGHNERTHFGISEGEIIFLGARLYPLIYPMV